ncbi:hypothetical protein BBK14_19955 [Parafrankia soli]|uniref:DUF7847 domain-containing protein n=1 Tax=Parafrankia soli TaxID=2599596 RepID=A0A1S1PY74_9ACTN|nr:glycerophosphoryl diester phosphodiesterase membrane domain-containing protein [Parafrankia soli]OHV27613.1 hypothetical protein BBK14_19955 [Parafrankia soli]
MTDGAGQTPPGTPGPEQPGSWGAPSPGPQHPPPGSWDQPPPGPGGGAPAPGEWPAPGGWQAPGSDPAAAPVPGQGAPPGYIPNSPNSGYGPGGYGPHGGYGQQPGPARGYGAWGPNGWGGPPIAPKPGVIPLRPLAVGEILDGTFATIRSNPGATLGLTLGATAVVETISTVAAIAAEEMSNTAATVLTLLLFGLNAALGIFLSGVLAVVVSEATLGGRITAGDAVRRVTPRLGGLLMLTLAVTLLSALGLVALIVGAVVVAVYLSLATPAYVLEAQSTGDALRRSWRLVKGSWWRTLGVLLLSAAVGGVLMLIFAIPTSVILMSSEQTFGSLVEGDLTMAGHIVNAIGSLLATTVATPVISGAVVLLYIDRRIRREGLDVTLTEAARQRAATP